MRFAIGLAFACIVLTGSAAAQETGLARPQLLLEQVVTGLPRDAQQAVRVMTASFKPGDRTIPHTHRFPVTVYVLEGTFTLEMKGHPPMTVRAGEALVEPPHVEMIGSNTSTTEATKVVIFYVSTPGTPFLDPLR